MKKFFLLMIAFITLLSACSQLGNADAQEESDCRVSFNFIGEITSATTPITKATTNDIFLLQVYRGKDSFASGIFDDPNEITVPLKKGNQKYRIIVALLKNGKERLGSRYSSINNSIYGWYGTYNGCSFMFWESQWLPLNNVYYSGCKVPYYNSNSSTVQRVLDNSTLPHCDDIVFAAINGDRYPQCDDWFYGEINDYSPTGEYETLNMELKRVGFKLKYELSGVTDGNVTVKVYNSTKTFIDITTNTSTYSSDPLFYAFYDARNAWLYADDYMENMTLSVSWLRGIGITENYGTKTIQIKRNCLNNIKINLGSNDQSAGMNLTVEAESSIGAENITIPVQ